MSVSWYIHKRRGWYLQKPDGSEVNLNEDPFRLVEGMVGAWFAPVKYQTQRQPWGEGEYVIDKRLTGRRVDLPLFVKGRAGGGLGGRIAQIMAAVSTDPERPSHLIWRGEDANGEYERRLAVLLASGAQWNDNAIGATYARVVLPLLAPDPLWEGDEVSIRWGKDYEDRAFLPVLIPINLTASVLYEQKAVTVNGVSGYPIWQVTGAARDVTITNLTTGEMFSLVGVNLRDGETMTIDTRPRPVLDATSVSIQRIGGSVENGWRYLTRDSVLWHLRGGENDVQALLHGIDLHTDLTMTYRERYTSPWSETEMRQ